MSNKTRLQTNNNNLQTILNTVNSLPEGDSGGGTGKFATGTITANGSTFSANSTIASYTGLGFKPKQVIIYSNSMVTVTYQSSYKYYFISACGGLINFSNSAYKVSSSSSHVNISSDNDFKVTLNDDGFVLSAGSSNVRVYNSTLKFIAIGGCEFEEVTVEEPTIPEGGGSND